MPGGWAVLQSVVATSGSTGTTLTATLPNNAQAGTKLICFVVTTGGSATVNTCQDAALNSLTNLSASASSGETVTLLAMDTPAGDVGIKPAIKVTTNAVTDIGMWVAEVEGLLPGNTAAMLDGTPGALTTNTGAASDSGPAYSSTATGEFVVGLFGDNGGPETTTVPSVYTLDPNNANTNSTTNVIPAYKESVNGSETGTWTNTGTLTGYGIIIGAFKLATGGVEFDSVGPNSGGFSSTTSFTSASYTHNIGSAATALLVAVALDNATTFSATVTAGGQSMAQLSKSNVSAQPGTATILFGLLNPPTGAVTIAATITSTGSPDALMVGSLAFRNAHAFGNPVISPASQTGAASSITVPGTAASSMVAAFTQNGDAIPAEPSAPAFAQFLINVENSAGGAGGNIAAATQPGGGSITTTWTTGVGGDTWGTTGIEVMVGGSPPSARPLEFPPHSFAPLSRRFGPLPPFATQSYAPVPAAPPAAPSPPSGLHQPIIPPHQFAPLSRTFGPDAPFQTLQPGPAAAPTVIQGSVTMAATTTLAVLGTLAAPVTMAATTVLSEVEALEAPVTMAAATALTTPNELESPVTLAAASSLSEVETLPTIASFAAAAGLSPVEALPTIATFAAASALTGPGGLAIPVTLASNSTLSNLNALGVSFTAAAALSEAETLEAPVTITAGSGLTTPSAQEAVVALTAAAAVTSPSELADLVAMAGAATLLTGSQNIAATLAITSAFTPGSAGGAGVSMSAASVMSALDALETNPLLSAAATFSPVEALPTLASFAAAATLVAIGGGPPPTVVKAFGFATVTGDASTSTVGTTEGPPSTVTGDSSAASVTGDAARATVAGDAGGGSTVT